jgi:uncharacterized repeat protein (TIGR01451 family)
MKKLILLFLVLVLKFPPAKAQWVTIPDANFVTRLQQLFPSCMNGNQMDTTCSGILNATRLIIQGSNISNLQGIEYFDNLNFLNFMSNQVSVFPELPPSIDTLFMSGNNILYIPSYPNSIKYFACGGPSLVSLSEFPSSLRHLGCSNCSVFDWPILPDSLQKLYITNSPNVVYPILPDNLIEFRCDDNELSVLPLLPNSLEILNCNSNQISDLPPLPTSLKQLSCSNNLLTELPTLPSSLNTLYLDYNSLSTLPELPDSLEVLFCTYNQLVSLPLLSNKLKDLRCYNNLLTELPAFPDSLWNLSFGNNQITSISPLPPTLRNILCFNNQLTSIPLLPDTMQTVWLGNNNITCLINLPKHVSSINLTGNPITCIPHDVNYYVGGLPVCIENNFNINPFNCQGGVNVTGKLFSDIDGNCNYTQTDLGASNIQVKLFDSQNNLKSTCYTSNGDYGFLINQVGSYQVKVTNSNFPFSFSCGEDSIKTINLNSPQSVVSNVNFPLVCNESFINNSDYFVSGITRNGWVFPGQIHTLRTYLSNSFNWYNLFCGSLNYSGTVSLTINGPVSFVAPATDALTPTVTGNTYTYIISDFNTLNPTSFGLRFMTDTTAQANDQICVHLEISPNPIDADTTNNVYDFCYNVVNSYDPNMKEVYPVNVLPGYEDWFTYTIHFQNTGNAPAFNIRLRDTLDTQLDLNTFEVLGYSHPANVGVSGNILTVRFNNIMLPDSTSDYEGSMGYFQYRIKPFPNLPLGSQISNTAYIYFDYNAPIITNTTANNFEFPVKISSIVSSENSFSLFPNPSTDVFTFKDTKNLNSVEVYSILGEKILSQTNQKTINLNGFSKGVYFARVNGGVVLKMVKE